MRKSRSKNKNKTKPKKRRRPERDAEGVSVSEEEVNEFEWKRPVQAGRSKREQSLKRFILEEPLMAAIKSGQPLAAAKILDYMIEAFTENPAQAEDIAQLKPLIIKAMTAASSFRNVPAFDELVDRFLTREATSWLGIDTQWSVLDGVVRDAVEKGAVHIIEELARRDLPVTPYVAQAMEREWATLSPTTMTRLLDACYKLRDSIKLEHFYSIIDAGNIPLMICLFRRLGHRYPDKQRTEILRRAGRATNEKALFSSVDDSIVKDMMDLLVDQLPGPELAEASVKFCIGVGRYCPAVILASRFPGVLEKIDDGWIDILLLKADRWEALKVLRRLGHPCCGKNFAATASRALAVKAVKCVAFLATVEAHDEIGTLALTREPKIATEAFETLCRAGSADVIRTLVYREVVDVKAKGKSGLFAAIEHKRRDIIRVLAAYVDASSFKSELFDAFSRLGTPGSCALPIIGEWGITLTKDELREYGDRVLEWVCQSGSRELLEWIIENPEVNPTWQNHRLLATAASNGWAALVTYILELYPDPDSGKPSRARAPKRRAPIPEPRPQPKKYGYGATRE